MEQLKTNEYSIQEDGYRATEKARRVQKEGNNKI